MFECWSVGMCKTLQHSNTPTLQHSNVSHLPHRTIGIVCTSPGWGGLELNTLRLARWLREKGWKVHLLTAGGSPIQVNAGDAPSSVNVIREEGLPGLGGQLRAVHAWVLRYKIRVLFVPFRKDIKVASLYKRFYDDDIAVVYQQHMQVGVRKRDLIHTLRYAMIDVWISPLQYLKEETLRLTRVPEEKIEVIPFGMDTSPFLHTELSRQEARARLNLPQDAYIIGSLGRLDPKKGQDLVVHAINELNKTGNGNYHALMMGNATLDEGGDSFTRSLLSLVRTAGLDDKVHFMPHSDEIMLFFRAIDVFAMPSHGETFGMVTIEAMAAGVPVVGTDKDGTREILGTGKYGWLFAKEDVIDFCRQVQAVRGGQGVADKVRAAREEALSVYSKERMVAAIDELLLDMVEEPAANS
jgi:glycosyltransferase involved in cell wall biosynthesis